MVPRETSVESLAADEAISNVLLLGSPIHADETRCCAALTAVTSEATSSTIGVAFSRTPNRWVADYRAAIGELPANVCIVNVGEQARLATSQAPDEVELSLPESAATFCVKTARPGNLTELGVRITECLEVVAPEEEASSATLCFRSLSPLLIQERFSTVERFLDVLTKKTADHGVLDHYHLDPAAHDDETIDRLKPLFDGIVEYGDHGEPRVSTR